MLLLLLSLVSGYTEVCQHRAAHPHQLGEPFAQRVTQYERDVHHRMKGLDLSHDLKAPWAAEANANRYLVYRPYEEAGLGNRMLGVASAWLLALLLDRILLVSTTPEVNWSDLFCEPILGATWLWPTEMGIKWFDGRVNNDLTARLNRYYPVPLKLASIIMDHTKDTKAYKALVCRGDLKEEWWMVQTIIMESNQWFVPLLLSNPSYRVRLQEWFPEGDIFSQVVTYLFHPANTVWQRYQETTFDLSIHLRYFTAHGDHVSAVLNCIQQHGLETEQVFLATMDQQSKLKLESHLNMTHPANTPEKQAFSTEALQSALLDILHLSASKELILSPGSTMGYIAQALSQRRAWLLKGNGCVRHTSHEPCFHVGTHGIPKNVCHGPGFPVRSILREPTVQLCPDYEFGWQMQVDYPAMALRKLQ